MTFFGITAVILVFFQFCILVRMIRTEQRLNRRIFKLECLAGVNRLTRPCDVVRILAEPHYLRYERSEGRGSC
jgi:hypothetical protein